MDKIDQKEGLFKRLKNIENAQKKLIRGDDKDDKNNKDKDKKTKQQHRYKTTTSLII